MDSIAGWTYEYSNHDAGGKKAGRPTVKYNHYRGGFFNNMEFDI